MAQTPREQTKKPGDKADPKKSDKVRTERFGDVGLDYITLDKDNNKSKSKSKK